jgi:hypothetical protein
MTPNLIELAQTSLDRNAHRCALGRRDPPECRGDKANIRRAARDLAALVVVTDFIKIPRAA